MKRFLTYLTLALALSAFSPKSVAADPPAKAEPNIEQRLADLEAYVNNGARGADAADARITSKVGGAGPGHNGFQMI